jgi:RNA polymerase-binding transcription factor DksA
MSGSEIKTTLQILTSIWMKAFEEERFHDALLCGFANFLISAELKDQEYEKTFLLSMRATIERLLPEHDPTKKERCSFCGRQTPDVRLAAGPEAFICNECVSMLSKTLQNPVGEADKS